MEPDDAEVLRRRLYRRGASSADVSTYLRASIDDHAPEQEAAAPTTPGRSPRSAILVVAAVSVAAIVCGVVLLAGLPAPAPGPTASVQIDAGTGRVVVLDSGARTGAGGTAVAEGPGRYRYTVGARDTVPAIARRFGLCTGDLLIALPYGFDARTLPPGQTLLLRRYVSGTPTYDPSGDC